MDYTFPDVSDFDAVRKIVLDNRGFTIIRHADHITLCYAYVDAELFPKVETWDHAARRELRGLTFDLDGKVISRPYHKFFNLGERPETQPDAIDLTRPHEILEKLDGSMVRPIPLGGGYRMGTKTGVSLLSPQPEEFIAEHPAYDAFIRDQISRDRTPIFEWCSRKQRIVLDYPDDRLVLTACRENQSGRYVQLSELRALVATDTRFAGVEVIRAWPGTPGTMAALIAEARGLSDCEGWVIRFDDGHMLKLKAEWYVARHRALGGLAQENIVISTILSGAADDVKPLLPPEPRADFEAFESKFWAALDAEVVRVEKLFAESRTAFADKTAFAKGQAQQLDPQLRALLFSAWSGKDIRQELIAHVAKHAAKASRVDHVRWAFGGLSWNREFDNDT